MKAITKIDITCSNEKSILTYTGKVACVLKSVVMLPQAVAVYQYETEAGVKLNDGNKIIPNEVADVVLGANPIDSMSKADEVFYGVLRQEMASTFGISVNDIEIVE